MRPVRISVEHEGKRVEHEFRSSPVQVGRNPKADLCLPYEFVSSWHAVIHFDEEEAGYFDLGSTNGTEIDGRRIEAGQGVDFDARAVRVQIGELTLALSRAEDARGSRAVAGAIDAGPVLEPSPSPQARALRQRLQPAHEQLQAARQRFDRELGDGLAALPSDEREATSAWLQRELPTGPSTSGTGSTGSTGGSTGGSLAEEVAALARELLPFADPPQSAAQAADLLRRVIEMMCVCAKGLVELQEGQDRLGKQLGVSAVKHYTGLRFALSAEEALAYLLSDPSPPEHERRRAELAAAFSDTIGHQIATLNGMVAGARALLDELEPAAIERGTEPGLRSKHRANWKTFVERWERLATRDGPLLSALFGPEFVRVYTEVGQELQVGWKRALDEPQSQERE
ncbi:MAG: type VI secretion system-associated FHA domain protein [Nannocystaceae bacterium]